MLNGLNDWAPESIEDLFKQKQKQQKNKYYGNSL